VTSFGNQVTWFFKDALPAMLSWFSKNWYEIFLQAVNNAAALIQNLATNIVAIFAHLPGLIAGTTKWSDVWKPLETGFVDIVPKLKLPDRETGELEKQLKDQYDRQGAVLGEAYAAFRKRRLDEIGKGFGTLNLPALTDGAKQAAGAGKLVGDAFGGGLKDAGKASEKLIGVLVGSADALAEMADYQAVLNEKPLVAAGANGTDGMAGVNGVNAVGVVNTYSAPQGGGSGDDSEWRGTIVALLTAIRENTSKKGEGIQVTAAGLT
jgi:hypothetical protein